jgi:hypothetical protein
MTIVKEENRQPIPGGLSGDVCRTSGSGKIGQIISSANAEMIPGSAPEAGSAEDLTPHLTVSTPRWGTDSAQ